MPFNEKLSRSFDFLRRKNSNKNDPRAAPLPAPGSSSSSFTSVSGSSYSANSAYGGASSYNGRNGGYTFDRSRETSAPTHMARGAGAPAQAEQRFFYPPVQYESMTSNSQTTTYQPLPPPPSQSQYPLPPSQTLIQRHSLNTPSPVPGPVSASPSLRTIPSPNPSVNHPSPNLAVNRLSPNPAVNHPSPPVVLNPLKVNSSRLKDSPNYQIPAMERDFHTSVDASQALPPQPAGTVPRFTPTPGAASNGSAGTPFSQVMEEWIMQLRTPTPDVTLLPSPYDFKKDQPTPLEKTADFPRLQEALLPTPPPDVHEKNQSTKDHEYITSSGGRRPLLEDIASLCRDLISQDINDKSTPSSASAKPRSASAGYQHRIKPEYIQTSATQSEVDPDEEDRDSPKGSGASGSSKGRRRKLCTAEGCTNLSRSRGLCKAHGGGRRCSVEGCSRASQSGSLCITHGGGKRCTVEGCQKAAQSRGMCKAHGGGVRCRVEGCTKSSQGDGFCRTHGGGRRCGHPSGCTKWAQRNGMCMVHSEGKYGNSYRGRLMRMQQQQQQQQDGVAATSDI